MEAQAVDLSSNLDISQPNNDSIQCGICYEDLDRKRTLTLNCDHVLHRTCILTFCEAHTGLRNYFHCPICSFEFTEIFMKSNGKRHSLPTIIPFGPTGQPSIGQWLAKSFDDYYFESLIFGWIEFTASWLLETSKDLQNYLSREESNEYIQDILNERTKLLNRIQILISLLEEHSSLMKRLPSSTVIDMGSDSDGDEESLEVTAAVVKNSQMICGKCSHTIWTERAINLCCGHSLHGACFLHVCDMRYGTTTSSLCPVCSTQIGDFDYDEKHYHMSDFTIFGCSGPQSHVIASHSHLDYEQHLKINNMLVFTANLLFNVTLEDIDSKTGEYLQEIISERSKLIHHFQYLVNLQEEQYTKERIIDQASATIKHQIDGDNSVIAAASLETNEFIETAAQSVGDEHACAICIEATIIKRSVLLEPCKHVFHRTCIMRWLEENYGDLSCCTCRTEVNKVCEEDGQEVIMTYPIEREIESILSGQTILKDSPIDSMDRERSDISKIYLGLFLESKRAIRDKKSDGHISDINEEIEKYMKRVKVLDNFHLKLAEEKEITSRLSLS